VNSQRWAVLGAGAIGCLFASALARAGMTPSLLLRDRTANDSRTITIERDGDSLRTTLKTSQAEDATPIDNLLVTTKAYDVEEAVASIAHRLHSHSRILLLVNGMGLADRVARKTRDCVLYCGTTTEGAYRRGRHHIYHAGRGLTRIGSLETDVEPPWFTPWRKLELQCRWQPQVAGALWQKLAINCAINPLTAIHRCSNGELATRPELFRQVVAVCDELTAISEAAGYHDTAHSIHEAVLAVIRDTAGNRSSMLQDVVAGRRTEIEFITGYLVEQGQLQGVPTPVNAALLEQVLAIHAR